MSTLNWLLRAAREALPSRRSPGACASREEIAKRVALWLAAHDPRGRTYPFDANHLGKIERGAIRRPSASIRAGLRAVLGATDVELGFAPVVRTYPGEGGEEDDDMRRRAFLTAASTALFAPPVIAGAHPLPAVDAALPSRIGASDVAALRGMVAHLRATARQYGDYAGQLAPALARAERLLEVPAAEDTRRALLSVVGELHRMAGWLAFDTNGQGACRAHLQRSMELCSAGDDAYGAAWACMIVGVQSDEQGHPAHALRLYELAQGRLASTHDPRVPGLTARLHGDTARALAGVGEDARARSELAAAWDTHGGDTAGLAYISTLAERARGDLDAAERYAEPVARLDGTGPDGRSPLLSRIILADLRVAAGEPSGAVLADQVIREAAASSARVRTRLSALAGTLEDRNQELAAQARRVATGI